MAVDKTLVEWSAILGCPTDDLAAPGRRFILECARAHLFTTSPSASLNHNDKKAAYGTLRGKKQEVHLLLCSDTLVISPIKKKSTFDFSRRGKKNHLTFVPLQGLRVKTSIQDFSVTLLLKDVVNQQENKSLNTSPDMSGVLNNNNLAPGMKTMVLFLDPTSYTEVSNNIMDLIHKLELKVEKAELLYALKKKKQQTGSLKHGHRPAPPTRDPPKPRKSKSASAKLQKGEINFQLDGVQTSAVFERMIMLYSGKGDTLHGKGSLRKPVTMSSSNASSTTKSDAHVHCVRVFKEILDTERCYVTDLSTLVNEYIKPLRLAQNSAKASLVNPEDLQVVFNNIEQILEVNYELLQSLSRGVQWVGKNGEIPTLCEIAGVYAKEFVRVMPFLKMYSLYCHQYTKGLDKISELRENNKEIDLFIQKREARKKNQQCALQSLLIKPVQRICKYPLLFRELIKYMKKSELLEKDDEDFRKHVVELEQAAEQVDRIASSVNEKVSAAENQNLVMQVYLELGGPTDPKLSNLLKPSRKYTSTNEILFRESAGAERKRHRLYLFNDLIVFAKYTGGAFGNLGKITPKKSKQGTLTKSKVKATILIDLETTEQCKVKSMKGVDPEGRVPVQLVVTSRVQALRPSTSSASNPKGSVSKLTTKIEQYEVWCADQHAANTLIEEIRVNIEELDKRDETRDSAKPKRKARAWTSRNRQQRTLRRGSLLTESNNDTENKSIIEGGDVDASEKVKDTASERAAALLKHSKYAGAVKQIHRQRRHGSGATSLDDITSKYKMKPREALNDVKQRIQIDIDFPEGPLGLALENRENPDGVFVALVAATGVAERGGLQVGDKLISVAGTILQADSTWEQVVEMIKTLPRPLMVSFERTPETVAAEERKQAMAAAG